MKALKMLGNRKMQVVDVPKPEARGEWVVVRVKASGLCGSELHAMYQSSEPWPHIPGHELAGEVAEVDEEVCVKVGDRVAIYCTLSCGRCPACRTANFADCPERGALAFSRDGGSAEYVAVPARCCLPLPEEFSFEIGALIGDAIATPWHGLRRANVSGADRVAVFGLGPIGLGAVIDAKFLGAWVVGVEISPFRLDLAKELGADQVVNARETEEVVEALRELSHGGVDVAVEAVGKAETMRQGLDALRRNGRMVSLGENPEASFSPSAHFHTKHLTMTGSRYYDISEYPEILELLRRGLPAEKMITHRFPLAEAAEAFRVFEEGNTGKVILLP